jgi:phage gp29-like protein
VSDAPTPTGRQALQRQVATLGSDPNRWLFGDRLQPQDEILARRGGSAALRVYEDLERDGHVAAVLQKRRLALVSREWHVDAGDESPEAERVAELVLGALRAMPFDQAVEDMLAALLVGVSVLEIIWQVQGDALLPALLLPVDPKRCGFRDAEGTAELRLLTKSNTLTGEPVPDRKFIVHRNGGRYGDPWGLGLGHRLYWPVFFKRQGVGFWLSALEKFGQPTALGKYPNGTSEAEQNRLLQALQAMTSESAVTIPDGMIVELLEAQRAGSFDSYRTLASYMDDEISKIVLGETLSTSVGSSGSRALGDVHNAVRLEITRADADRIAGTLQASLVRWIVELNLPGYAGPLPRLWWDVSEPEDLKGRAERDTRIKELGFAPTDDYIRDTYGEGWERAAPPPAPPPAQPLPSALAAAFAEAAVARRRSTMPAADDGRDAPQELAQQLDALSLASEQEMVAKVAALVDGAPSLAAIAEGLALLYPTLADEAFNELLGDALTLAALRGRSDITDEAR